MKAYKFWHNTKYFIHKDTTNDLNVTWTENIDDAKEIFHHGKAITFFFDLLGFSLNLSKPDALYLM
jgi:hypothetical protein